MNAQPARAKAAKPAGAKATFDWTDPLLLEDQLTEDARPQGRRRLRAERLQDVDHQQPDRRRVRRLGEERGGWRRDPRLRPGEGDEGPLGAEDRGEVQPARL